ncbi:RidA family protein [Gryllotalpicola koreensis]|uniref:RidA family protein n=1 Tax=Gryllotalpicola koreensis TaxID=993086 RepID=A0ABP8AAB1_9MICO
MPEVVKVKSGSPYEERESYSRVVRVGDAVFVSNCAGRNYATREMSTDPVEQTRQAFKNIEGALRSVGAEVADIVRSRVTVPNPTDAPDVMAEVGKILRGVDPASTVLCSPLGGPDYKVEIEVTAVVGVGASEQERKTVIL